MVQNLEANPTDSNLVKSSWAKDYVILFIGFGLVLLSNFSSLNKKSKSKEIITTEEKTTIENAVVAKSVSTLIKEGI